MTKGYVAIVDDDDYSRLFKYHWSARISRHTVYARRVLRGEDGIRHTIWMHREIMGLARQDGRNVDHINRNGLDNRKSNLRSVSPSQNQWNRGARGYYLNRQTGKFHAQIWANRACHYLGQFDQENDARCAYLAAKRDLHAMTV